MNRNSFFCLILLILGLLGYWNLSKNNSPKVVIVKVEELYKKFDLTKAIDKKYVKIATQNQLAIDSIELELNALNANRANFNESILSIKVNQLLIMQKEIEEGNSKMRGELESQIWTQLNEYVTQYAEYKQLDLVLGNVVNGGVLYQREMLDVTEEVIIFVNEKYNGFN